MGYQDRYVDSVERGLLVNELIGMLPEICTPLPWRLDPIGALLVGART